MDVKLDNNHNKILCLSKVPISVQGGIPKFLFDLYSDFSIKADIKSIDITKFNNSKNIINNSLEEKIYPTILSFKTISFSLSYLFDVIFKSNKYKCIHYNHPDPFSAIALIIRQAFCPNTKIIITWHADIYKSYPLFSPILILIDAVLFSIAHKIVYLTPAHKSSSLFSDFSPFVKKSIFIPNGIHLPLRSQVTIKKNIADKKVIKLLSIGRLVKYKGLQYSIEAVKLFKKQYPDINIQYIIIGDGVERRNLEKYVIENDMQDTILFTGLVSDHDKIKYLAESDIFLFPSINQSEAYGLAQIEAMSMGIPIINTQLKNGVNYLAPSNECAITVESKNSKAISSAINMILNDENTYFKLSKNCFEKSFLYSIEKTREEYFNLFIKIIS